MNIKIIVATHKSYWMPSDPMYIPLHVGREGKKELGLKWQGDDSGENISSKNAHYCELTGMYWAWKNLQAEAIGLVHYRRHFAIAKCYTRKKERVLTQSQAEALLTRAPVIVPPKRNYYIETVGNQYSHAHHEQDLIVLRTVLEDYTPESLPSYDTLMNSKCTHLFNMFIMRRMEFNTYCTWLFTILFELEKRLDISLYSKNDSRVFGFLSERLLDVWLNTNHITFLECPVIFMERQNWIKKGGAFLLRKFCRRAL